SPASDQTVNLDQSPSSPASDQTVNLDQGPSSPASDQTVNLDQGPSSPVSVQTVNLDQGPSSPASDQTVILDQGPSSPASDKTVAVGASSSGAGADQTIDLGQQASGMAGDTGRTVDGPETQATHRGGSTVKATATSDTGGSVREIVELPGEGTVQRGAATTVPGDSPETREAPRSLVIQTRQVRDDRDDTNLDVSGADYIIEKQIGKGGMGVVLRAHQSSVGRKVALKSMLPEYAEAGGERVKFVTEAVVTAVMDHPNVVPIYDLGVNEDGSLFYVMKEIEGTPWNDCIGEKTLSENLNILLRMADAMAYAHARDYLHRDLKPENIMVGDFGEVLVMDWGLAVSVHEPESWNLAGTPAYMAPEMASHPVDGLGFGSDIYLMGAILFEILTGSPAHAGASVMDCVRNAARNEIVETAIDNELMSIARKAMATDISDRYASIIDFQQAIREYQTHAESVAMSDRAAEQLTLARQNDDYEAYAQARFGFHEATTIWPENEEAQVGQREALLGHAQCALLKEDFGLGLSLLTEFQDAPVELLRKLQRGQKQRQTAQKVKRVMVAGLVAMVVAATAGFVWALSAQREASRQQKLAQKAQGKAKENEATARKNAAEAVRQRELAEDAQGKAEENEATARENAAEAVRQQELAEEAQGEAEANAYRASIGQIASLIQDDEFETANEQLGARRDATTSGWEWFRLKYLTKLAEEEAGFVQALVAVDWSTAGKLAIADSQGAVRLLDAAVIDSQESQPLPRVTTWAVRELAFSSTGEQLAVVGGEPGGTGGVEIWDVATRELRATFATPQAVATCHYLNFQSRDYLLIATTQDQGDQVQCLGLEGDKPVVLAETSYGGPVQQLAVVLPRSSSQVTPVVVACGADGVALWELLFPESATLQREQVSLAPQHFRSLGKFREHTGEVTAVDAITVDFADRRSDVLIVSAGVDRHGLGQVLMWTLSDWRKMLAYQRTLSGLAFVDPSKPDAQVVTRREQVPAEPLNENPQLLRLSVAAKVSSLALNWGHPGRHADGESKPLHLLLAGAEHGLQHRRLEVFADGELRGNPTERSAEWVITGNAPAEVEEGESVGTGKKLLADWVLSGMGRWAIEERSRMLLKGHGKPLTQALFHPRDDTWQDVVSVSEDGFLRKWNLEKYEEGGGRRLESEQAIFSSATLVTNRIFAATATGYLWEWSCFDTAGPARRVLEGHLFLARHVVQFRRGSEQFLLTTSRDQSANLWNLDTSRQVGYWERFCGPSGLVSVSADGSQIITDAPSQAVEWREGVEGADAGDQRARSFPLYRWRWTGRDARLGPTKGPQLAKEPEPLQTPHFARITHIVSSPDSRHFATADADGKVYLWDANRGPDQSPLRGIPGDTEPIARIDDICFLGPDRLVLALSNGAIHNYQVADGKFLGVIRRRRGEMPPDPHRWEVARVHLVVSPDSGQLAIQVAEVRRVELRSSKAEYRYSVWSWAARGDYAVLVARAKGPFQKPPTGLAYSPNGKLLATIQGPRDSVEKPKVPVLRVWREGGGRDSISREFRLERKGGGVPTVESMVFLDENRLVTVGADSSIGWRISAEQKMDRFAGEEREPLAATEDFAFEPQRPAHAIVASSDERFLVTANGTGTATVWEADAARVWGRLEARAVGQGAMQAVAFANPTVPGQPYLVAAGDIGGGLTIGQIEVEGPLRAWRVPWSGNDRGDGITALAWKHQRLAVGTSGGRIYLFDTQKLVAEIANPDTPGELKLDDELGPLSNDEKKSEVTALVFDPSGQYLAVARGEDEDLAIGRGEGAARLRIYKVEPRQAGTMEMIPYRSLQGHAGAITCARFLGRGPSSRLATGSRDNAIKIWDWGAPAEVEASAEPEVEAPPEPFMSEKVNLLLTLQGHKGEVSSLNFSKQENALISGGKDGRIIVWRAVQIDAQPVD
ncbi:MAG: hypothetical protein CMJ75_02015, partial [Planctomycetaceae bacterium]|nr:hypothetical protein [Planctomycetaceae bacterium]